MLIGGDREKQAYKYTHQLNNDYYNSNILAPSTKWCHILYQDLIFSFIKQVFLSKKAIPFPIEFLILSSFQFPIVS